ncbi:hypothetical protein F4809DRAFT_93391 [Biscogniauxia mediterranea]|nr:hypothetical protein F4809DRAFT_93391 [Biscogniauxia mediterranea]
MEYAIRHYELELSAHKQAALSTGKLIRHNAQKLCLVLGNWEGWFLYHLVMIMSLRHISPFFFNYRPSFPDHLLLLPSGSLIVTGFFPIGPSSLIRSASWEKNGKGSEVKVNMLVSTILKRPSRLVSPLSLSEARFYPRTQ